jgi:hypothetical protein
MFQVGATGIEEEEEEEEEENTLLIKRYATLNNAVNPR